MGQPVVVVGGDAPSADFAAGVAAATAVDAAETAETAEQVADSAALVAGAALEGVANASESAAEASVVAAVANARIDRLEAVVEGLVGDLVLLLNDDDAQVDELVDDLAPPVVTDTVETPPEPTKEAPADGDGSKRRKHSGRFGSDAFFGKRD